MSIEQKTITIEELRLWPDGENYELFDGEPEEMTPSSVLHGRYGSRIDRIVGNYVEANKLGDTFTNEAGYILSRNPDTLVAPDFSFVAMPRLPSLEKMEDIVFFELAPDFAVEVNSPSDRRSKIQRKVDKYLAAGVPLVWVVDPYKKTVTVYRPGHEVAIARTGDHLEGYSVLPGFNCAVDDIFK